MNTRLQVEHPVTEMRSLLDLVKLQLLVAMGQELKLENPYPLKGYAMEVRIYAEDPYENFMPSPGEIKWLSLPSGQFVRVDSGVYQGYVVPDEYDPLLLKIIAWGNDRIEGIERMKRALGEFFIAGITTTREFCLELLEAPFFKKGEYDTFLLERWKPEKKETAVFLEEEVTELLEREVIVSDKGGSKVNRWKDFRFFFNNFEF